MPFLFGDYALDVDRRELVRRGQAVAVEPQVFDLLVHLIRNRDRVVTKDDLLAAVWDGRVVSESTLTTRINSARRAVGDSGARQETIRTVARKGFRFVAQVTETAASKAPPVVLAASRTTPSPWPFVVAAAIAGLAVVGLVWILVG